MSDISKTIVKVGTILMACSFPVGLLVLSAPDDWFLVWRDQPAPVVQMPTASVALALEGAVAEREAEIKKIDADISNAKAEVDRLAAERESRLGELETLQRRIIRMLHEARSAKADFVVPQPVNTDRAGSQPAASRR